MIKEMETIYKFDQKIVQQLKRSKNQQGFLTPIVKDQYGNILSGRHRHLADKDWPEQTVQVEDALDRAVKTIHYNVQRRPSQQETEGRLLEIAEILESRGIAKSDICRNLTKLIPYSERHIERLLPAEYKRGYVLKDTFEPQLYNVWSFGKCDERFGNQEFEGRIPGQIIQNLLHYFTEEKDLVVDPMAGGGTTIDVCRLMNRRILAYDISPTREDITKHDIRKGFPEANKNCDLIFLDPPYFDMVFDLFKDVTEFYTFIESLASASYETIKDNGVVAFLMQDMTEKGNHCLSGEGYRIFRDIGFKTVAHISCPLSTQQFLPQQVEKAKKEKRLLGRNRDLYIFRKV